MILQITGAVLIAVVSASSAHPQDQQATRQPGWPCAGTVDRGYALNAEATGGKVLLFRKTELSGVVDDMTASSQHGETVFRASAHVTQGTYEFEIPVDSPDAHLLRAAPLCVSLEPGA